MTTDAVEIRPIGDADLPRACAFMRTTLNTALSPDRWMQAFRRPWMSDKPNNGFMMLAGDELVGVQGAIYATRMLAGRSVRTCNLTSWSVSPSHRGKSLLVLGAALKQPGFVFTN